MRSRIRSWLVILPVMVVALFLGGGLLLYLAMGGLSVSVAGTSLTVRNSGLVIRDAQITVFNNGGTMTLNVPSLPAGSTTLALPSAVSDNTYEGACIEGARLGGSFTWYFASIKSILHKPVVTVTESNTDIPSSGSK